MSDHIESSRVCSVGLLATEPLHDLDSFNIQANDTGYDFVVTPISQPSFKSVLNEEGIISDFDHDIWKDRPFFDRKDLIINSAEWSHKMIGLLASWIQLDSADPEIRLCSELALKQEIDWACHISLSGVIFPFLPKGCLSNTARTINSLVKTMTFPVFMVRVPLTDRQDVQGNISWKRWNRFRTLTETNPKIYVALEITSELPADEQLLDLWLAEPVKEVIVPAEIFVANTKGYPVLPKAHQLFIQKLMDKMKPDIIVTYPKIQLHKLANPTSYLEYIRYLNRRLPRWTELEQSTIGYHDYLQAPLQPLMDNLENQTYEVFEKDPVKYQQYEKAVYKALLDRVEHGSDYVTTIMVVGAGRGPLVNCCLRASEKSERKVHIFALEKNPNAYVTLQNVKAEKWGDKVTLVFADMRKWNPPTKCDILVSELLGSFGDNELSPECLDGAQKFIKDGGISIPASYTSYASPLASTRLFNNVGAYKELERFEIPYVVLFQQVCELAPSKALWTFEHPTKKGNIESHGGNPLNNLHNKRYSRVEFTIHHDTVMHGIAGYFECVLYKDVMISIRPETHSPDMLSWFPIYFPIRSPVQIPKGSTVSLEFWRLTDATKVWYEWTVSIKGQHGEEMTVLPIHNVDGQAYYVGL
ncbi:PRMT5 arginine-N-methyltransferase-domain-containing protein [Cokeromyces recurvatus]|uniref:PRMT5 arginine-N-methyltransferase-domain-containing protein n=1 Tax=Cokeromyces recurvatus TaxID=90255 RepID=UPI00221F9C64|nr:PRMT5 arginine-N-methyltransferase-domain-containing protein [Cokeromyces recurvatus]KAI7901883.1 PRMT5 arginine-N-methyltransferase-domain-containing protein [Cokeromyces recurvatus]